MIPDPHSYKQLLSSLPFLTYLTYGRSEYIGIIQNIDDVITSIYDYSLLQSKDDKLKFIELGEVWWNESNREIPINVFLRSEWHLFRPVLRTFNSKDVIIKFGPALSLKAIAEKRSKRKSIQLIRKV